jgi:hypothetical protein
VFLIDRATDSGFTQNLATFTAPAGSTSFSDTSTSQLMTYYYRVRATNSGGTSSPTNTATATTPIASGWADQDIGQPALSGSASSTNGIITQSASGTDIWGTTDSFNYWDNGITGDAQITAHITSLSAANGWAKSGVMIRQSTAPNSAFAGVFLTPTHGACFISRSATAAGARVISNYTIAAPYWVRIARTGNTFTGSISPDGTVWTVIGSASFTMAANAYIGLAVTAHDNTTRATAIFDNVSTSGSVATAGTLTSQAITASAVDPTRKKHPTRSALAIELPKYAPAPKAKH